MKMPLHLRGAELVVSAFGDWPSFHDARVEDVRVADGTISFTVRAFEMTSETDGRGYFRITKHHDVRFRFGDVVESTLPERSDILAKLALVRASFSRSRPELATTPSRKGRSRGVAGREPCHGPWQPGRRETA